MKSVILLPRLSWKDAITIEFNKDYLTNNLTLLEECSILCDDKDLDYFAIDSGAICRCGPTEPIKPNTNAESNCSPCYDDPSKTCGNVNYGFMSVYQNI